MAMVMMVTIMMILVMVMRKGGREGFIYITRDAQSANDVVDGDDDGKNYEEETNDVEDD